MPNLAADSRPRRFGKKKSTSHRQRRRAPTKPLTKHPAAPTTEKPRRPGPKARNRVAFNDG
ncbi:replication protein [Salmonella enterica]|nr:replication protein [Salmonella enterica]ECO0851211.1 replication protein [Salmonella enterica subsp. enterica serovar Newport]